MRVTSPSRWVPVWRSTVLPGQFATCCWPPVSWLNRLDLPTLGLPASATRNSRGGVCSRRRKASRRRSAIGRPLCDEDLLCLCGAQREQSTRDAQRERAAERGTAQYLDLDPVADAELGQPQSVVIGKRERRHGHGGAQGDLGEGHGCISIVVSGPLGRPIRSRR